MPRYTLHYWPIPFRGQFVRAVLTQAGAAWDESTPGEVAALKDRAPDGQPVPHMAPPVLEDHAEGVAVAQMPAILHYLGLAEGLIPGDAAGRAAVVKIVADANDVLYEMTRYNGAQMWTREDWDGYRPRLARWMAIFEETGARHGMETGNGWMLGGEAAGLADLVTAVLWGTMTDRLPPLRPLLDETAPRVAGLCDRVLADPAQAALRRRSAASYGDAWCGGQIEDSLRAALGAD